MEGPFFPVGNGLAGFRMPGDGGLWYSLRMIAHRPVAWLLAAMLLAWTLAEAGSARLAVSLGDIEGPGFSAANVMVSIALSSESAARLTADTIALGDGRSVSEARLDCPRLTMTARRVECPGGSLHGRFPWLGRQRADAAFSWERPGGDLRVSVDGLRLAGGTLRVRVNSASSATTLSLEGAGIGIDDLLELAAAEVEGIAGMGLQGTLDITASGRVDPSGRTGRFVVDGRGLTGGNEAGTLAFEALDVRLEGDLDNRGGLRLEARSAGGQLYAEPVFLDLASLPGELAGRVVYRADSWRLEDPAARFGTALEARGRGGLEWSGETAGGTLDLAFSSADAGTLYEAFLKPFLFATPLDDLAVSGRLAGRASVSGATVSTVALDLDSLELADRQGRFSLAELGGRLAWPATDGGGPASTVGWGRGSLLGLELGAADVSFELFSDRFRLAAPTRIPLLDGALHVEHLEIAAGEDEPEASVEAELEPISLERLTAALGWPTFGGQLSGSLPLLTYRNGEAILGGTLTARVFDGTLDVENLRLIEPLGELPRLFADIRFRRLDLEAMSRAFSFGRITGRLDGDVAGLDLLAWEPVAFDARLYSTPGGRERRRISQRAVENLSSIGGSGAAAALSGTFLSVFDDFAYQEIGLSCRLAGGVCRMGGVGPAENGYYLVQGRGIPRIDVVGYAEQVDWPRLVTQLKSITLEGDVRVD